MWLLCLLPLILIFLLPAMGMRLDMSWIFVIIILSLCFIPMLMMKRGKKDDNDNIEE